MSNHEPFEHARRELLADVQRRLLMLQRMNSEPVESIDDAMTRLHLLRRQALDDLNEIQRDYLLVLAAEWLVAHGMAAASTRWQLKPRAGGADLPPLVGRDGDIVTISAEVNASDEPIGAIDAQMRRVLFRLSTMPGRRFYFVRSASMKRRAVTKVIKAGWDVAVVQLAQDSARAVAPTLAMTSSLRTSTASAPR
jgi:hypothetical protein